MSALNFRHFECKESASERETLLAAARDVMLDVDAANAFLDTDELKDEVWKSYGTTIREANIGSIPLFVFNVPAIGKVGGPLRKGTGSPIIINGSMDPETFLQVFTQLRSELLAHSSR